MATGGSGRTVLLLTGFQRDFCESGGAMARAGLDVSEAARAVLAAAEILAQARAQRMAVIHVRERRLAEGRSESTAWSDQRAINRWPEDLVVAGAEGEAFVAALQPLDGEYVVDRFRSSAISDTRTPVLLRSVGATALVVCGVETHRSVLATVVDAVGLDLAVTVVPEAVGSTRPALGAAALDVMASWARSAEVRRAIALQDGLEAAKER